MFASQPSFSRGAKKEEFLKRMLNAKQTAEFAEAHIENPKLSYHNQKTIKTGAGTNVINTMTTIES